MRRRPLLRALLGTAGLSGLAGCNGLFGRDDAPATRTPTSARPATDAGTGGSGGPEADAGDGGTDEADAAAPTREPYRAAGAPALDRPRSIRLRNLGGRERFLTLAVDDGDREVYVDTTTLAAGDAVTVDGLVGSAGTYRVVVETADGARREFDWTVDGSLSDLWVELAPAVRFRRLAVCGTDCPLVTASAGEGWVADPPPGTDPVDILRRTPAIAVDNPGRRRRATVRLREGADRLFERALALPRDVRAVVPIADRRPRYQVDVRAGRAESTREWLPGVRRTLYASVADGPSFRCGLRDHDLRVRNETDRARRVAVEVHSGSRLLFDRVFDVGAERSRTVPAAVDPVGPFRFRVETGGDVSEFDWRLCAPHGPLVVVVSDRGVIVTVQSTIESA